MGAWLGLLWGLSLAFLGLSFWSHRREKETSLCRRLADPDVEAIWREQELREPLSRRIFKPWLTKLGRLGGRFLPGGSRKEMWANLLAMAGHPWGLGVNEFLALKVLAALTGGMAFVLFFWHLTPFAAPLWGVVGWLLGFLFPDFLLRSRIRRRQREVRRQLPEVIDLLTVSVEAGLGFEGALTRVVEKMDGPLPQEICRALQEIRVGRPRREALREMAQRIGVEELLSFVGAVIMAEQMGVSLARVLRLQSQEIRRRRRQQAQEAAFKAPVKMLLPLVLCIFPATFVVLLGPAVLRIMRFFGKSF
ncbi:Type II secretion system F domain protein [Ammonifex degensii KC4]|uniref:Type II secretion system F domain protein n=1 Tax=Ammonifex degensii (strain DSM 10501 / KC4) TaxID=429009 RepID=C9RD49_AMMDK|nr:type II secretion system F family protein [Ammonifex degensii]ACX52176.1 Type II secretion system F domain protein [Ammonifex degensii KC4]